MRPISRTRRHAALAARLAAPAAPMPTAPAPAAPANAPAANPASGPPHAATIRAVRDRFFDLAGRASQELGRSSGNVAAQFRRVVDPFLAQLDGLARQSGA